MDTRRTFLDSLIVTYVAITLWAFFVTMTHIFPTGALRPVVVFSYGMMAPYQGSGPNNKEIVVLATSPTGTTELRSLNDYFPGLHGEKNSRQLMEQMLDQSPESLRPYYQQFAAQFLGLEKARGKEFVSVELWLEQWPRDARGYTAGRDRGVERTFLYRTP